MPSTTNLPDAANILSTNQDPGDGSVVGTRSYLAPISGFVKACLPESLRDKSYAEISKMTENGKNVGMRIIQDAWAKALAVANSRAGLYGSDEANRFRKAVIDLALLSVGGGLYDYQLQQLMTGFDKNHASRISPNVEMAGPTFITRPRLCLQSSNLRNNEAMMPLDTANGNSLAFAIRWLLDSNLCNPEYQNATLYDKAAQLCPLINQESPWMTPFCNSLLSISGFPDLQLQVEKTDGGFFSEAQDYAVGHDHFAKGGYTFSTTFRELPGDVNFALIYYWTEYIRCVTRNIMMAYPDDIDGQIMNYTVSIYTFNMDPTMKYITKWAKCTGCFPTTLDFGSIFNKSEGQYFQDSAFKLQVSWSCSVVEYMRPQILLDFNRLAMKYCPTINSVNNKYATQSEDGVYQTGTSGLDRYAIPASPFSNFCGLPFIVSDPYGYRLEYRYSPNDLFSDPIIQKLTAYDIMTKELATGSSSVVGNAKSRYRSVIEKEHPEFQQNAINELFKADPCATFDSIVNEFANRNIIKN